MAHHFEVIDGDTFDVDLELEPLTCLVRARDLVLDLSHRRRRSCEGLGLTASCEQGLLARKQLEHAVDAFEVPGAKALVDIVMCNGVFDEVALVQEHFLTQVP